MRDDTRTKCRNCQLESCNVDAVYIAVNEIEFGLFFLTCLTNGQHLIGRSNLEKSP